MGKKRTSLLIAVLTSAGLITWTVAATVPSSAAVAKVTPKASATPSAAVQMFADRVETLGAYNYPNSFAGARLTPAGVTDVYALPTSDGRFVRAVGALDEGRYAVRFIAVKDSYNRLNAMNAKVNAANTRLFKMGIRLSQSWPDPATGSVMVSVAAPVRSDYAALRSATDHPVSAVTYSRTVARVFQAKFGSDVRLTGTHGMIWKAASRSNDTSPFYDGDEMSANGITCTGGFNMTGNRSGHVFMYTAGHCPSGQWSTGAQVVGSTSTNYLGACATEEDYQSIYLPGGGSDDVWGGSTGGSLYTVTGQTLPAPGTLIAFDGSITNEVRDNDVLYINDTIYNIYNSINECYYNSYPSIEAESPTGQIICRSGDSGGPVIQHLPGSSTNVDAVGTIVAYGSYDDYPGGSLCVSTEIGSIESVTDTTLIVG